MIRKLVYFALAVFTAIIAIQSCRTYYFRSNYTDTNQLIHQTNPQLVKPFLKAHLKNGDICILQDSWEIDTLLEVVNGRGTLFDFNRKKILEGDITICIDSVAIFETNAKLNKTENGRSAALSLLVLFDAAIGIYCLINPKACFGSCPTFYINEFDNFHYSDAEGFSNAISPSMEYGDIDALNNEAIIGNTFSITMKNEALETHCVREVKLLAYPRKKGERIYHTPTNDYFLCEIHHELILATAGEDNITDLLKNQDQQERFSLSDDHNLYSKEEIFMQFENVHNANDLGLILNFRQTLMTTYLFYSAMDYMGDEVSDIFAILETDPDMRNRFDATTKMLGGIDVYLLSDKNGDWEFQGSFDETGPIAINRQFLPLSRSSSGPTVNLKLVLNKGLWRIDYAALANIKERVTPMELSPTNVLNKGVLDHSALEAITNQDKFLISMPGNEYKFNFILPGQNDDYELFLYSRGYYLEWIRPQWLKEKNLAKLKQMVDNPKKYLIGEAKNYKQYEATMEQEFWNSKIDTKTFTYYEN
jgi:hypothetical protein